MCRVCSGGRLRPGPADSPPHRVPTAWLLWKLQESRAGLAPLLLPRIVLPHRRPAAALREQPRAAQQGKHSGAAASHTLAVNSDTWDGLHDTYLL